MFVPRLGTAGEHAAAAPASPAPTSPAPARPAPASLAPARPAPARPAPAAPPRIEPPAPDSTPVTVRTDDGVDLAVRVSGPDEAALTLVFTHGHCLRTDSWTRLCARLRTRYDREVRLVCYDHRGHGESGAGHPATYTIDQLARDLDAVLRAVAPTGPVVLVGHSMGAMVLLAYSRLFAEAIGTRVAGVGLIAGAATGLTDIGLARLLHRYAVTSLQAVIRRAPRAVLASKRLSSRLFEPLARGADSGAHTISPYLLAVATTVLNETPLDTMAGFLTSLIHFDEVEGLHRLGAVPTLVLAGSADVVVPFAHSVVLASQLADCELVRVQGAGHSVIGERTEEVADALTRLIARTGVPVAGDGVTGVAGAGGFAIAG
ncbi:MAG TPA: alpha/beta hydrolase [Nocardia sp.]|uniref:alpha/beta fold hydrolase n=1 Tax=Nocardia TaxID=1817 RepID=UPI0024559425|nr:MULTISPECIES: alpha/beta hydrolase [Nocardia]HLS77162.1 alpha/beta hydrolase [Nocardia sp.]